MSQKNPKNPMERPGKKALHANDVHSHEEEEWRKRSREMPECAKAHPFSA